MKYVTLLLLALSLVWVGEAPARDIKEMSQVIKKPIEIPGGTSPRMSVMFPHTAHKGINCMHCHHEVGSDSRYVACTECHATPGARERDPMSMFMALPLQEWRPLLLRLPLAEGSGKSRQVRRQVQGLPSLPYGRQRPRSRQAEVSSLPPRYFCTA